MPHHFPSSQYPKTEKFDKKQAKQTHLRPSAVTTANREKMVQNGSERLLYQGRRDTGIT